MPKAWSVIYKRMIAVISISIVSGFIFFDFYNFSSISNQEFIYKDSSFGGSSNTQIFGNRYTPDSVIIKRLNQQEYSNSYDMLLEDLKIITSSKNSKIVLIQEKEPIFYDYKYIYLSSKQYLNKSIDLNKKDSLIFVKLIIDDRSRYNRAIERIELVTQYFKDNYNQLYNNLDSIVYDRSQFLDFFISGCRVRFLKVHQNSFSDIKLEEFERKFKNLDLFISNQDKVMMDIKEIDLRWDNIDDHEGVIVWENN